MKTLLEQQAKAWRLAPNYANYVAQSLDGEWWHAKEIDQQKDSRTIYDGGYLYKGEINGWDWRDTLQSREEWEAMNKQDEKWVPEVGQECEVSLPIGYGEYEWVLCTFIGMHGDFYVYAVEGDGYDSTDISNLRPIQTPADKYREEQIEQIAKVLCIHHHGSWMYYKEDAKQLFETGIRVLTPDEFPAKLLTEGHKVRIFSEWEKGCKVPYQLIDAVQNAMLGEEK